MLDIRTNINEQLMEKLELKKIMDIFYKNKVCVIAIIIIFLIFGCLYTFKFAKKIYVSSTTFLLGVPTAVTEEKNSEEETTPVIRTSLRIDAQTISTYNEIVKSNASIKAIKDNLKIDIKEAELKKAITVTRAKKSDVIKVIAKYTDKQIASDIANETVKVFSEKIKEIYKISEIYIIDVAFPAEKPMHFYHVEHIMIFTLLGLLVVLIYCTIIVIFDKTIKSSDKIEEELGIKVLASIPNKKSKKQSLERLLDFQKEKSPILKAFKQLSMNVQFTNIYHKTNKVMLITSVCSVEGKSYVAANLAAVLAQTGKKVIVIDMDMRVGRQASIFETPNNLGISNYLSNIDTNGREIHERINSYIKETSIKNLNIITSGSIPPNTSELLTSNKLPELIKDLSVFYDCIILDGAPTLPVTDSLILARIAGSILLVSLENKTKKEDFKKAKKDLQNVGGRIIGLVLNQASMKNKKVHEVYLKLEEKIVKNKKRCDIKNKFYKIKKWICNYVKYNKKRQLLLEQKKENTLNINKKEPQESDSIKEEKIQEKQKENIQMYKNAESEQKENMQLSKEKKLENIVGKKDKKLRKREEKRKKKEQKSQKTKEGMKINEEILEDNLYPKTKYNKNL